MLKEIPTEEPVEIPTTKQDEDEIIQEHEKGQLEALIDHLWEVIELAYYTGGSLAFKIFRDLKNKTEHRPLDGMRVASSFVEAIDDCSIFGAFFDQERFYGLSLDKKLTKIEQDVLKILLQDHGQEKQDIKPKIGLISDIDGVLVNTESVLNDINEISALEISPADKLAQIKEHIKRSKMTYCALKKLLTLKSYIADGPLLLTDRFRHDSDNFPFISGDARQMFARHGIEIQAQISKRYNTGEEYIDEIANRDITYYIGSSPSDEKLFHNIQSELEKRGLSKDKIIYIEVLNNGNRGLV